MYENIKFLVYLQGKTPDKNMKQVKRCPIRKRRNKHSQQIYESFNRELDTILTVYIRGSKSTQTTETNAINTKVPFIKI